MKSILKKRLPMLLIVLIIISNFSSFAFAEELNLQAIGGENKITLNWTYNSQDLINGFNLYRMEDGTFTKINDEPISSQQNQFTDNNVEPGVYYYYKFTVVREDLSESDYSNIASAVPYDTIAPVISHTPVQAAFPGLPLQIDAEVTDNVRLKSVTLFYRTYNNNIPTDYSSVLMINTIDNMYSATIDGPSVVVPGLEYYIVANDDINITRSGRADTPYYVQVSDFPKIDSISPASGPSTGGTNVVITGNNFKEGATVTFGNAIASNVVVESSTRITATTPVHYPADVDVKVTNKDGYSSLLLLGFSYESDVVEVSIPYLEANVGEIIEVPINIANADGLLSIQMKINFNSELLSFKSAKIGNLTEGFMFSSGNNSPGEVSFSAISATPTSGTGSMALVKFEVLSSEIKTSDISFNSILINDGSINVNVLNGLFSVMDLYEINGNVSYFSGGYTINNASLKLDGARTYDAVSSVNGIYKITGIERGDYSLSLSKSDEAEGISAYDASLILQYLTGKISLNSNQLIASDVNRNGDVTAMDASYILQRAVGLLELPFPGAGEVWTFVPNEMSYSDLHINQYDAKFTGILLGDISGNWNDGAELLSISNSEIVTGDIINDSLTCIVPIGIECKGENTYALDLVVSYDPANSKFIAADSVDLTENCLIVTNEIAPGIIKIAIASDQPIPSGKLLDLKFTILNVGVFGINVENASVNERQVSSLDESYLSNGLISHFVFAKDGKKIVVPLANATGYAYAYSTQNELYQYLRGSNSTPTITGLLSGTKYMPVGGYEGYAINYSLNDTAKEAMQYTPWFSKEEYNTYFLFEGFDLGGNAVLTPINQ